MLTYKVLLVDDEEEVMDVIEHRICWKQMGFEVVGKAQNGVKALEISEKMQPDVVITDIKMPYMDGLELARNLKQDNPDVRILILTGFDEFEYAKEAVHLEIEEYILKPVNANELSDCLKRLKDVLDKEREEKLNIRKLEQYYTDSLPVLQTNFFCSLIEGRITEGEIREAIRRGARSLDGVKRRVRAGMGRCQGGFCSPRTLELLHEELGIPMTELTKSGGDSRLLAGRTKEVLS